MNHDYKKNKKNKKNRTSIHFMDVQVTHGHLIIRSQEHHVWFKGREVDGKGSGGKREEVWGR